MRPIDSGFVKSTLMVLFLPCNLELQIIRYSVHLIADGWETDTDCDHITCMSAGRNIRTWRRGPDQPYIGYWQQWSYWLGVELAVAVAKFATSVY